MGLNIFKKYHLPGIGCIVVLLVMFMSGNVQARTIGENEARNVALSFFSKKQIPANGNIAPLRLVGRYAPGVGTKVPFYIYNSSMKGSGFVVVSADDRALPVLGYSDEGTYDPANVPPAMQEWLDFLADEISALGDDNTSTTAPRRASLGGSIKPLLKCNWGQDAPYNILLPTTENGERAVTGCVATAMAQVMYYHKWPSKSTAIPEYTSQTQGIYRPALEATSFDWANMQNNYVPTSTGTSVNAVAKLMLYCDQALEMDFKDGSSSASTINTIQCLLNYFSYNAANYVSRQNYTREAWEQLLYSELKAKRPVIFSGATMKNSGHAFVCDGYDNESGLFHINWGWDGGSNGYFALSALTTKIQGTGGSAGVEGYIYRQAMVIGILPNNQSISKSTAMTFTNLELPGGTTYTRSSASENFVDVQVRGRFSNYTGEPHDMNPAWALYKGNTFISLVTPGYLYQELKHGWGGTATYNLNFGANLSSGTYQLVPVSRIYPDGQWEFCEGADINYVVAKITSTTLTLIPYGVNGNTQYSITGVTDEGYRHVGKTLKIIATVKNTGTSSNNYIYMFENGVKSTMEMLDMLPGSTGTVTFFYRPESTGTKTLTFSLNDDGSSNLSTYNITIGEMPFASLTMSQNPIGIQSGGILPSNNIKVTTTVTNKGSNTYDEEVMVYLCRVTKDNGNGNYSGKVVRTVMQPVKLNSGKSTNFTLNF
ncbi:MAG: C10 family peptidase, partial [Muribaculaceae bacterium]|nr:C10 family peptidase [Muribaculaceae bacterium]